MSEFRCLVQEASTADTRREQLEASLRSLHAEHYPGETPTFTWVAIPYGHMFTEGEHSTSSIVSAFVDHETTFDGRERYLRGVCDIWTELTGCTDHEIVATITEPELTIQE